MAEVRHMKQLKRKCALITGASQGLGRQLAIEFARQGATGIALVARDAEALHNARQRIMRVAPQATAVVITADLGRQEDIERVAATTLSEFGGRLDVLVNNASSLGPTPIPYLLDYPLDDFRNVLEVNLIARTS